MRCRSCSIRTSTSPCSRPSALACPPCASRPRIRSAARKAAALGYPGGGALTVMPAAVSGRYQAIGFDIYDEGRVRREILELRAAIERGDSGGPLILENGTVGGVIFAESRTNETSGTPWHPASVGGHPPGHRPDEPGRYRDLPALTLARPALVGAPDITLPTGHRPMPDAIHPYDRPSDPAKRHSARLTDGPDRAGARGMLKAIGFTDEDLAKPLIGVGDDLDRDDAVQLQPPPAGRARQGRHPRGGRHADGIQHRSAVSDGVSMGTEGMKASLVSREVVADSIELVVRGHLLDGVVCVIGCDKTGPGAAMALGRLDVPGLILYSGTIYPGTLHGQRNATVVVDLRGDRRLPGRQDHARRAVRDRERCRAPARGLAAASSRPTRCRWPSSSSACRPPASTASRPRIRPRRTRLGVRRAGHGPRSPGPAALALRHP